MPLISSWGNTLSAILLVKQSYGSKGGSSMLHEAGPGGDEDVVPSHEANHVSHKRSPDGGGPAHRQGGS